MSAPAALAFDDGDDYERFMGRWSRAACRQFVPWLAVRPGARWLDVGCGTGILAEAIDAECAPEAVWAIDPAAALLVRAQRRPSRHARFQVADARALPFAAHSFDAVAAALVLNFVDDRSRAVAEMSRVARPDGVVAAFVWDFANDRSPSGAMRRGLRALGRPAPPLPGSDASTPDALRELFAAAGLRDIVTATFDVRESFAGFEEFWDSQLPRYSPATKTILALAEAERRKLREAVRAQLREEFGGRLSGGAVANAVRGTAP